jgi:hypothetical protein
VARHNKAKALVLVGVCNSQLIHVITFRVRRERAIQVSDSADDRLRQGFIGQFGLFDWLIDSRTENAGKKHASSNYREGRNREEKGDQRKSRARLKPTNQKPLEGKQTQPLFFALHDSSRSLTLTHTYALSRTHSITCTLAKKGAVPS